MQSPDQPVLRDIVLVGGGHSHVGVIRRFGMRRMPGVRLTVICRDTHTPYSGMLPGYVAGHYSFDDVHIDLRRLAEFAGARFFRDEAVGLDRGARKVLCRTRPPVPYDQLSINIGSTPMLAMCRAPRSMRCRSSRSILSTRAGWRSSTGCSRIAARVDRGRRRRGRGRRAHARDAVPPAQRVARLGARSRRAAFHSCGCGRRNPAYAQCGGAPIVCARAQASAA